MTEPEVREKFAAELVGDQDRIWKAFCHYMRGQTCGIDHEGHADYYRRDVESFIEWGRFGKVPEFD